MTGWDPTPMGLLRVGLAYGVRPAQAVGLHRNQKHAYKRWPHIRCDVDTLSSDNFLLRISGEAGPGSLSVGVKIVVA